MSLIDDVAKKRFSRGRKFETNVGRTAFKKEMKEATIHSPSFSSLKDNLDTTQKWAEKWKPEIRKYGDKGIPEGTQKRMYEEMIRTDKTLTNTDKKSLKAIIKNWGTEGASKGEGGARKNDATLRAEKRKEQIRSEMRPSPAREVFTLSGRGLANRDVKPNPLSRQPRNTIKNEGPAGSGGGIRSWGSSQYAGGSGGGISSGSPSTKSPSTPISRPPSLLR